MIVDEQQAPINHYPVMSTTERLLTAAVDKGLQLEALEKLIELKNKEEARQAKAEFALHFAIMQGELKPVKKTHEAKKDGRTMYTYATIEDILRENGPIIASHGFSYKWREEESEAGRRFICVVSGYGHTEETSFDTPKISGTSMMNPIQVMASMSTYGRRYSLLLAFGILVEDEDDDGQSLNGAKEEVRPASKEQPKKIEAKIEDPQQNVADERTTWPRAKLIAMFSIFSAPTDERGEKLPGWVYSDSELADLKQEIVKTQTYALPALYDRIAADLKNRQKEFLGGNQ